MLLALSRLESPVGRVIFAADDSILHALEFLESEEELRARVERSVPGARFAKSGGHSFVADALCAYFVGEVDALERVAAEGAGTPFQRKVWAALRTIPPGRTLSYRGLAQQIGCPGSFRAVGAANGQNPISLVVPCHRVIAADGTLCGYGGGLWRKEWLLRHEGALLA
jgi:O-6-methylguanine DNA methyltransferase